MTDIHPNKLTTLANGEQVPLSMAASIFDMLRASLEDPDSEWDLVYYLRQLCLGEGIEREHRDALRRAGLVNMDGLVEDTMKAVVLSSVRGEGKQLHLDSPFTDADDRKVAECLSALLSFDDETVQALVNERSSFIRKVKKHLDIDETIPDDLPTARELVDRYWPIKDADTGNQSSSKPDEENKGETTDEILKRLKLRGQGPPPPPDQQDNLPSH